MFFVNAHSFLFFFFSTERSGNAALKGMQNCCTLCVEERDLSLQNLFVGQLKGQGGPKDGFDA